MSNDMKCPFCGEEIEHIEDGWCNCKNRCTGSGSIELWLQFLRTRKALDIVVDKLKGIKAYYDDSYADPNFVNWHIVAQRLANDADDIIKTITALEQKERK